jgi:hypothetical protein
VEDVAANGPVERAPGSGANSVGRVGTFGRLGIASTLSHSGIFLAYCSNGSVCSVLLWRVGALKAVSVPSSANGYNPAVAPGPNGRLWIAWADSKTGKVLVVRTNEADTKFGPVEVYPTPCSFTPIVALGGGSWGRLDVSMSCTNTHGHVADYATQLLAPLSFSPAHSTIVNSKKNSIVFKVTDVGDPVAGATVHVDGMTAATNSAGTATISFPKGATPGGYQVTVKAPDYYTATGQLTITK